MAEDRREEPIDLNKLSQRELLILLHSDVKDLKSEMKEVGDLKLKVNSLETKSRVAGGITGFLGAILTIFAERFLTR